MVGAVLLVFTEIFILDEGKRVLPENMPNITAFLDGAGDEEQVEVSALRAQHQAYLENGVKFSDLPDTPRVFPDPIVQEEYAYRTETFEKQFNDVAPAAGVEGDIVIENAPPVAKSKNFEGMDDIYGAIYQEHSVDERSAEADRLDTGNRQKMAAIVQPSIETETVDDGRYTYKKPVGGGRIAIIIDDMGLNLRSRLVELLPAPLTLAYLPYAKNLPEQTSRAQARGHELMVHMPMEAMNGSLDGGPRVLKVSQSQDDLRRTLNWGLSQFKGYVGMNNHMGSRLTSNEEAMQTVISTLKKRDLFFIDSRTIGSTVAADVAKDNGLAYAERDIFLDHEITPAFIRGALAKLEDKARSQGYAIAIGHPHKETIDALKEWLPTLKSKGLTLVPASSVLHVPVSSNDAVASN